MTITLAWWIWPLLSLAVCWGVALAGLSRPHGDYEFDVAPLVWGAVGLALFCGLIAGHFL